MFFDYPQYYPYEHDDFYRALAAQRARERREAEYRTRLQEARQRQQLEETLRRNAYQNYLGREQRRRSMYPYLSGFDSDEEHSGSPYYSYFQPAYEPRHKPRSQDFLDGLRRQHPAAQAHESEQRRTTPFKRRQSPGLSQEYPEFLANTRSPTPPRSSPSPKPTRISIQLPSPKPDIRDQAARKIQAFFRTNMPRLKSLKAISSVAQEFQAAVKNFTFPTTLDFAESDTMELLYTSRNAPVHLYEHTLLNFLSKLDSIDSHGDEHVRSVRKNLVREIEGELGHLDARKVAAWEAYKSASSVISPIVDKEEASTAPIAESTSEPEVAPIEIIEESTDVMDCSSQPIPKYSSSDIVTDAIDSGECDVINILEEKPAHAPEQPFEQPPVIKMSENQTQAETTSHHDSTEAQDSEIVPPPDFHPSTVPYSQPQSSDPSGNDSLLETVPNVDSSIGMDQSQSSESQEGAVDRNIAEDQIEVAPEVSNNLMPSVESIPTRPIELCV